MKLYMPRPHCHVGRYAGFESALLTIHVWSGTFARLTVCWCVGWTRFRFTYHAGCINIGKAD